MKPATFEELIARWRQQAKDYGQSGWKVTAEAYGRLANELEAFLKQSKEEG